MLCKSHFRGSPTCVARVKVMGTKFPHSHQFTLSHDRRSHCGQPSLPNGHKSRTKVDESDSDEERKYPKQPFQLCSFASSHVNGLKSARRRVPVIHSIQRVQRTVGVRVTVQASYEQIPSLLHRQSRPSTVPFLPGFLH